MADGASNVKALAEMTDEELDAEVKRIDAEQTEREKAAARRAKLTAVARDRMIKENEPKLGPHGVAFDVVEGLDGFLFSVTKPAPALWKAFNEGAKAQEDWDKLYRACVRPEVWDKVSHQYEETPGIEDQIVTAILKMLGKVREVRTKR